jgi:hypothetical protein
MDNPSLKTQIAAYLLNLCEPLIANGKVRKVERKSTPFLLEPALPALHLLFGKEDVILEDERGYNLKFQASFKIMVDEKRDPYTLVDELEAFLQEAIEADPQLGGLASKVTYVATTPFVDEVQTSNFTIVTYDVEYRRYRAKPDTGY